MVPTSTSDREPRETPRPQLTPAGEAPEPGAAPRPNMMRRPPKAFLLLAFALTALFIGGVIAILSDRPGDDSDSAPLPVAQPMPAIANETDSIDRKIATLERRLEELGTELALRNTETTKRIDEQAESLRALQEQVSASPVVERIAAVERSFSETQEELAKRMAALELSLKELRAAAKPAAPKRPQPALPFELVSVDTWDGVPYAALSHEGRIELVRQGQSRAGWTVQLIDASRGLVLFRSPQGRAIERSVGR
jgi:hypothetical protein